MKNKQDILLAWGRFARAAGMDEKDDPVLEICSLDDDGLLLVLACYARLGEFATGTRLTLMDVLCDKMPPGGREGLAMMAALEAAGLRDMTRVMAARLAALEAGFLDTGTVRLPPAGGGAAHETVHEAVDEATADPMVMARLLFDAKKIEKTFFVVRLGVSTKIPDDPAFRLCPDILEADGLPAAVAQAEDGSLTAFAVGGKMLVVAKSGNFCMAACEEPAVLGLDTPNGTGRYRLYRPWNYRNGFNATFEDPLGDRLHPFPVKPGPIRDADRLSRLWLLLCVRPFLALFGKTADTADTALLGLTENLPATNGLLPVVSLKKGFWETAGCDLFKDPGGRSSHELLRAAIRAHEDEIRREFSAIPQPVLPVGGQAAHERAAWRSARRALGEAARRVLCRDLEEKTALVAGMLEQRFPDGTSVLDVATSRPDGIAITVEDRGMASVKGGVGRRTIPNSRFPAHFRLLRDGDGSRFRPSPPVCAVSGKGGRMMVAVTVPVDRMDILLGEDLPGFLKDIPPVAEDGTLGDDPVADRFFHPWAGMTATLIVRLCAAEARKMFPDLMPDKGRKRT